ncbi:MAG: helix-turn-helix transcriptional regulator [Pseudomonadota bacterium]
MNTDAPPSFSSMCREWRQYRKLSQLELALAADVSQRHVSWLETGRSHPSREMVIKLSDALDIPLRERNVVLQAAGFAPLYQETALDDPRMQSVQQALTQVLDNHEPLPAVVVDRLWNVRMLNRAGHRLFSLTGDAEAMTQALGGEGINLALLTLHPDGLRKFISNWDEAAPAFVRRLQIEAMATGDSKMREQLQRLTELTGDLPVGNAMPTELLPVLPLTLSIGELSLSLFSVISTFGTPQDITTDELRIEAFYPSDEITKAFFRDAGQPQ